MVGLDGQCGISLVGGSDVTIGYFEIELSPSGEGFVSIYEFSMDVCMGQRMYRLPRMILFTANLVSNKDLNRVWHLYNHLQMIITLKLKHVINQRDIYN